MKVIVVGARKGGVGKTFCSLNLAAALSRKGIKTVYWDSDVSQDGVNSMARLPESEKKKWMPAYVNQPLPSDGSDLEEYKKIFIGTLNALQKAGYDAVVLDTSARFDKFIITLLKYASIMIHPINADKHSINSVLTLLNARKTHPDSRSRSVHILALKNKWKASTLNSRFIEGDLLEREIPYSEAVILPSEINATAGFVGGFVGIRGCNSKKTIEQFAILADEVIELTKLETA